MDAPVSGDIFPAVEAIRMIDEVDLTPPIEVPPVSPDAYPENVPEEEHRWLESEIRRLKKERNAYILAHNYAPSDIQDVADAVGDSLYLAQKGAKSDADILLEASVLFMNQILAIMKKPHQRVLAPDLGALCSLAAHADAKKIRQWKREHRRWNRHQLRQYLFGCEGGERLLLRLSECGKGHTACVGQFRPRSTDSFSSRCLSRVLRRQASGAGKSIVGAIMAHDGRLSCARPYSPIPCRKAETELSRCCGGGPPRMRLHERLYAPDGARDDSCTHDAVSFHPRHGAVRPRDAAKGRHHGHRSRQYLSIIQSRARQDHSSSQPGSRLRLYETKHI